MEKHSSHNPSPIPASIIPAQKLLGGERNHSSVSSFLTTTGHASYQSLINIHAYLSTYNMNAHVMNASNTSMGVQNHRRCRITLSTLQLSTPIMVIRPDHHPIVVNQASRPPNRHHLLPTDHHQLMVNQASRPRLLLTYSEMSQFILFCKSFWQTR